jgi:DNA-directed RNA polymerase alpha subunit
MTQTNINTMDTIVNELTAGKKLSAALSSVYSKRNVAIPHNDKFMEVDIKKLRMSMRTTNALLRGGIKTIGDVVNYCREDKITTVKTLGTASGIELFETILDYAWNHMSKIERVDFLTDIVERNENNLK